MLVVDDTDANRDVAARWLGRKGYSVDTADNGMQALERVRNADYDAVLLDVMMPGMSGIDVLRTLRQSRTPTELPVIMATAKDASDDVVEAINLGANDYVTKPLDFPVLARVGTQVGAEAVGRADLPPGAASSSATANCRRPTRGCRTTCARPPRFRRGLPTTGPAVAGYDFAWRFEPSAGLAGDILNVFASTATASGAYVLDVSGYGVAAALLSVTVSRFLSQSPTVVDAVAPARGRRGWRGRRSPTRRAASGSSCPTGWRNG